VEIENNNGGDLKDLRGMQRNTKSLKRNDGERKGILIAPLMLPRSVEILAFGYRWNFNPFPRIQSRLRAQILRRGWQADD
jgi:hypothetical protein